MCTFCVSRRDDEAEFQIDWTVKTLNVTGIGLVIVLLTKQRQNRFVSI